jgi:hypothetical protein
MIRTSTTISKVDLQNQLTEQDYDNLLDQAQGQILEADPTFQLSTLFGVEIAVTVTFITHP